MMTRTNAIRTTALGAAGVLAAGATVLALQQSAQATPEAAASPVAVAARTSASEGLPQAGDLVQYVQRRDTVTVYRGGAKLATVTPRSAEHPKGKGELVLELQAVKNFSFPAGQFIWEDPDGADHEATHPKQQVEVTAGATTTATIEFDGVGDGDVIWAPTTDEVAGAWTADGGEVSGRPQDIPRQFLQRGSTVTVYKGGRTVAEVTARSASHRGGKGKLTVKVNAVRNFSLYPEAFIWENVDGGDHEAVGGPEKVTVKAGTTRTYRINYRHVGRGDAIWVPAAETVAGAWTID